MGALHFEMTMDNSHYMRKIRESRQAILDSGKTAEMQMSKIDGMHKRMAMGIGAALGVQQIASFGRELINITGQFQVFEAVLTNTLQSPEKAKSSMRMLSEFAATTPFQVDELTGSFVKLANQGFTPTYQQMIKLGDLASSTGKGFGQLTEAIIDAQVGEFERLKEFGIRASKQGDKVTFTFKEQATQVDFTAASIREYMLSLGALEGVAGSNAKIAETLTGQMSNLQDGITNMMNKIGQSSEGALSGVLSGASYLVEHYEEVGRVLTLLVATYGTYRAALMLAVAQQKALAVIETVRGFNKLTIALRRSTQAQILLNNAVGANPYAKLAAIILGLGLAIWQGVEAASAFERELNKIADMEFSNANNEIDKLDKLKDALEETTEGSQNRREAIVALNSQFGSYFSNLLTEKSTVDNITMAYNEATTAIYNKAKAQAAEKGYAEIEEEYSEGQVEKINNLRAKLKSAKVDEFDVEQILRQYIGDMNVSDHGEFTYKTFENILSEYYDDDGHWKRLGAWLDQYDVDAIELKNQTAEKLNKVRDYDTTLNIKFGNKGYDTKSERTGVEAILNRYKKGIEKAGDLSPELFSEEKIELEKQKVIELVDLYVKLGFTKDQAQQKAGGKGQEVVSTSIYGNSYRKAAKEWEVAKKALAAIKKDKDNFSDKARKDAVDAEAKAKKAFIALGGDTTSNTATESAYEKAITDQKRKNAAERHDIDKQRTDDKLKLIKLEYDEEIAAIQLLEDKARALATKEGQKFDNSSFVDARAVAGEVQTFKTKEVEKDRAKADVDAWNAHLAEYGTALQKEEAITKIYAQKILDAKNEGERLTLGKERDAELKAVKEPLNALLAQYQDHADKVKTIEENLEKDLVVLREGYANAKTPEERERIKGTIDTRELNAEFEIMQQQIDWSTLFSNLGSSSTTALKALKGNLESYVTSAGDKISPEIMQTIIEAMEKLDTELVDRSPIESLLDGYQEYGVSLEKIKSAKEEIAKLDKEGKKDTNEYAAATKSLTDAEKARAASISKMSQGANEIGEKGREVVGVAGQICDTLGNLGVSVPEALTGAIDGLGSVFGALESIDLAKPFSIVTGAIGVVTGVIDTVASLFGGSNEISEGVFDHYDKLMSTLDDVIAKQKELIGGMSGEEAVAQTQKSIELVEKQIEASQNLGKDFLASGASWRSHSEGYKLNKSLKAYKSDFENIGIGGVIDGNISKLFDLSAKQLQTIKNEIPAAWASLDDNTRGYLQSVIDGNEEITELINAQNEALTGISFDSAKSELESFLNNADATFEDVADSFESNMMTAINRVIASGLDDDLQQWYENFAKAMESDGLSEQEREDLQKQYEDIYKNALEEREAAYEIAGVDPETEEDKREGSSKGGMATASQESVDENNGRLTSIHGIIFDMSDIQKQQLALNIASLPKLQHLGTMNSHLATISENTAYCRHLEAMGQNMGQLQSDMSAVKLTMSDIQMNGLRMKR